MLARILHVKFRYRPYFPHDIYCKLISHTDKIVIKDACNRG